MIRSRATARRPSRAATRSPPVAEGRRWRPAGGSAGSITGRSITGGTGPAGVPATSGRRSPDTARAPPPAARPSDDTTYRGAHGHRRTGGGPPGTVTPVRAARARMRPRPRSTPPCRWAGPPRTGPAGGAERSSDGPARSTPDHTQAPAEYVGARPMAAVISTTMARTGEHLLVLGQVPRIGQDHAGHPPAVECAPAPRRPRRARWSGARRPARCRPGSPGPPAPCRPGTGSSSGRPRRPWRSDIRLTACQVMLLWRKANGKTSSTWCSGRRGATVRNHSGGRTGAAVSGQPVGEVGRRSARARSAATSTPATAPASDRPRRGPEHRGAPAAGERPEATPGRCGRTTTPEHDGRAQVDDQAEPARDDVGHQRQRGRPAATGSSRGTPGRGTGRRRAPRRRRTATGAGPAARGRGRRPGRPTSPHPRYCPDSVGAW